MIRCYIGIGGNLNDARANVLSAVEALKRLPDSRFSGLSPLYRSRPMGPSDQPDYINAVVSIDTRLTPLELLNHTQKIEQHHGRVRKAERWGPRTLDLDILLYGDASVDTERLTIPHYGMRDRAFVLYPLYDLDPGLIFNDDCKLAEHLSTIKPDGLEKLSPEYGASQAQQTKEN